MNAISPWKQFAEVQEQVLNGDGAFLAAVDADGRPNAMTIGWIQIGTIWARPVCLVLVRPSRYTHGCIEHSGAFTVNVPPGDDEERACVLWKPLRARGGQVRRAWATDRTGEGGARAPARGLRGGL